MLLWRARIGAFALVTVTGGLIWAARQTPVAQADEFQWLEDVSGERSLAWVKAENARSDKVLKTDPRYHQFEATALKLAESPQRLPYPELNGGDTYNTWQDAEHVQGILRRTSLDDYLDADPHWKTLLDYDALSKHDHQKWVQQGRQCFYPGDELCMVALSAGGEDAVTMREFNLQSARFVENGFTLGRSKQTVEWLDKDTLLVARDWGPGTMAHSGYPFIVKLWRRGQQLGQAKEVYRGSATDYQVWPETLHDGDGHQLTLIHEDVTFFETQVSVLTPEGTARMALPRKLETKGLVKGRMILLLDESWTPEGTAREIPAGAVVALDIEAVKRDPGHLKRALVFAPTALEFAQDVSTTRNHLLITTLENVQGRVYSYPMDADGHWTRKRLDLPDNRTVSIVSSNWSDDRFFV